MGHRESKHHDEGNDADSYARHSGPEPDERHDRHHSRLGQDSDESPSVRCGDEEAGITRAAAHEQEKRQQHTEPLDDAQTQQPPSTAGERLICPSLSPQSPFDEGRDYTRPLHERAGVSGQCTNDHTSNDNMHENDRNENVHDGSNSKSDELCRVGDAEDDASIVSCEPRNARTDGDLDDDASIVSGEPRNARADGDAWDGIAAGTATLQPAPSLHMDSRDQNDENATKTADSLASIQTTDNLTQIDENDTVKVTENLTRIDEYNTVKITENLAAIQTTDNLTRKDENAAAEATDNLAPLDESGAAMPTTNEIPAPTQTTENLTRIDENAAAEATDNLPPLDESGAAMPRTENSTSTQKAVAADDAFAETTTSSRQQRESLKLPEEASKSSKWSLLRRRLSLRHGHSSVEPSSSRFLPRSSFFGGRRESQDLKTCSLRATTSHTPQNIAVRQSVDLGMLFHPRASFVAAVRKQLEINKKSRSARAFATIRRSVTALAAHFSGGESKETPGAALSDVAAASIPIPTVAIVTWDQWMEKVNARKGTARVNSRIHKGALERSLKKHYDRKGAASQRTFESLCNAAGLRISKVDTDELFRIIKPPSSVLGVEFGEMLAEEKHLSRRQSLLSLVLGTGTTKSKRLKPLSAQAIKEQKEKEQKDEEDPWFLWVKEANKLQGVANIPLSKKLHYEHLRNVILKSRHVAVNIVVFQEAMLRAGLPDATDVVKSLFYLAHPPQAALGADIADILKESDLSPRGDTFSADVAQDARAYRSRLRRADLSTPTGEKDFVLEDTKAELDAKDADVDTKEATPDVQGELIITAWKQPVLVDTPIVKVIDFTSTLLAKRVTSPRRRRRKKVKIAPQSEDEYVEPTIETYGRVIIYHNPTHLVGTGDVEISGAGLFTLRNGFRRQFNRDDCDMKGSAMQNEGSEAVPKVVTYPSAAALLAEVILESYQGSLGRVLDVVENSVTWNRGVRSGWRLHLVNGLPLTFLVCKYVATPKSCKLPMIKPEGGTPLVSSVLEWMPGELLIEFALDQARHFACYGDTVGRIRGCRT